MSLGLLTSTLRVLDSLKDKTSERYNRVSTIIATKLDSKDDYAYLNKKKTRLQLVMLSLAVCGIEFCYAAETAFVTPTLLKIGVPVLFMSLIWGVSPLLGLFLVPVLGSLSDRCSLKLGRRRPFIILLSVGIVAGLLLVPNGQTIGRKLDPPCSWETAASASPGPYGNDSTTHHIPTTSDHASATTEAATITPPAACTQPWSILFTVIGVVLLDFSCDACQSPCRAYLLDASIPEDHSAGLSTFTIMAGLGGSLGYVMGGFNWEATSFGSSLGGHVRVVFTAVLIIYIVCVSMTLMSFKEVPLCQLNIAKEDLQPSSRRKSHRKYKKFTNELSVDEETAIDGCVDQQYGALKKLTNNNTDDQRMETSFNKHPVSSSALDVDDDGLNVLNNVRQQTESENTAESVAVGEFDETASIHLAAEVSLKSYLRSIIYMPRSLVILCVTNLFCWMSLVCYSLYFTDFVGQAVYGGDPAAAPNSSAHARYDDGVRLGSLGMAAYSVSCSVYSLNIERLVKTFGEFIHNTCMCKSVYVNEIHVYC